MFISFANIAIVSFGAFWALLWLSIYSSHQIYPYGGYLRRLSATITDYRDGGKIVLTPVYLLFGLASPLWLDLLRFGRLRLSSAAGLISIGIGDSIASIIGRSYGRNRWFRDGKSLEGMFANFTSQLMCLSALQLCLTDDDDDLPRAKLLACCFLSALLEAATDQIDNFILPLIISLRIGNIKLFGEPKSLSDVTPDNKAVSALFIALWCLCSSFSSK